MFSTGCDDNVHIDSMYCSTEIPHPAMKYTIALFHHLLLVCSYGMCSTSMIVKYKHRFRLLFWFTRVFLGYDFVGKNRFYSTLHYVQHNVNDSVAAIQCYLVYALCKNIAVRNIFVRENMLHYAINMNYGMIGPASWSIH